MFDELTMGHLFFKVATMSFFSNVAANCKFLIRIIRKDGLMIAISIQHQILLISPITR